MQRCSTLADKVLWDGEGAISTRQLPLQEAKSTTGTSSVDGEDDEWDVTYIRKESFQKMFPNGQVLQPIGWMQRFRQRRLILEPCRHGMASPQQCSRLTNTTTTGTKEDNRRRQEATVVGTNYADPAEGKGRQVTESPSCFEGHHSLRTMRDEVDGTALLVRQNAKVFNRPSLARDSMFIVESSNESSSHDIIDVLDQVSLLRHLSSITTFEHGSLRRVQRTDWGDPFMMPDSRLRWEHDDDLEDTDIDFSMAHDAQQQTSEVSPIKGTQGSASSGTENAGNYPRMPDRSGVESMENGSSSQAAHHSERSTRDDFDGTKKLIKQNGRFFDRALLARGSSSETGATEDSSTANSEAESLRCPRMDSGDHLTIPHSKQQRSHDDDSTDPESGFCMDHHTHQPCSERSPISVESFRFCRDPKVLSIEAVDSPSGERANEAATCPIFIPESSCLRKGLLAGTKEAEFYINHASMVHSSHPSDSHQCDILYTPPHRE